MSVIDQLECGDCGKEMEIERMDLEGYNNELHVRASCPGCLERIGELEEERDAYKEESAEWEDEVRKLEKQLQGIPDE